MYKHYNFTTIFYLFLLILLISDFRNTQRNTYKYIREITNNSIYSSKPSPRTAQQDTSSRVCSWADHVCIGTSRQPARRFFPLRASSLK